MTAAAEAEVAAYRSWQRDTMRVHGRTVHVATKPGVFAHGSHDEASQLLAELGTVAPGDRVLHLNCGSGLFGALAADVAAHVLLTDRNVLSFEAATRSVAANADANGATSAQVALCQGAPDVEPGSVQVAAIRIPHDRLSQLQLLRDAYRALAVGGVCYIAGASNEGIKPAARAMERLFGNALVLATRGGHRVVRATKQTSSQSAGEAGALPEEFANPLLTPDAFHQVPVSVAGVSFSMQTRPGVFSWEHLDEATETLANAMQVPRGASVLDLGCGCGTLGTAAALSQGARVCMLDADSEATRCAAATAERAGVADARAIASDIALAVRGELFDIVLCNPPFHVGKATSLDVPMQFIVQAWNALAAGGSLQLVANRTLPYERAIEDRFGNLETLHDGRRFKVLRATR